MATAMLTDAPTTSCLDETAEVRIWDLEDDGDPLSLHKKSNHEDPPMNIKVQGRVEELVTWAAEDSGELMRDLQNDLRRGDRRVAQMLAIAVRDRRFDADARSLALETLAAARVRWFEAELVDLVRSALDSPEPELQFAGIAAAGDLSRSSQVAMSRVITTMTSTLVSDAPIKQAAEAFLRKINRSLARL